MVMLMNIIMHLMKDYTFIKGKTEGFDKVIECCGNSGAVSEAIMLTKNGGKIVLVGVSMEPITIPSVIAVMGEIRMLGSIAYSEFDFNKIISLIKDKQLDVIKYIDKRITLDEVQDAFIELTNGKVIQLKLL